MNKYILDFEDHSDNTTVALSINKWLRSRGFVSRALGLGLSISGLSTVWTKSKQYYNQKGCEY